MSGSKNPMLCGFRCKVFAKSCNHIEHATRSRYAPAVAVQVEKRALQLRRMIGRFVVTLPCRPGVALECAADAGELASSLPRQHCREFGGGLSQPEITQRRPHPP